MSDRPARRRNGRNKTSGRFWRGRGPLVGAVGIVVILTVAFLWLGRGSPDSAPASGEAELIAAAMTSVPASAFDAVGSGGALQPLRLGGSQVSKGASGKSIVIYVGGDFCPYCASQRWAIVAALSRFGYFSGLALGRSSSTDVFPSTATFSFHGSSYTSDIIEFAAVETADREGKPLEQPTATQQASLTRFDPQGSIPFLSIGDRYFEIGSAIAPDLLAGKSWQEIAALATDPKTALGRAVLGNANYITAAICDITGQLPANVCSSPAARSVTPPK
jgi:hypothetical protein